MYGASRKLLAARAALHESRGPPVKTRGSTKFAYPAELYHLAKMRARARASQEVNGSAPRDGDRREREMALEINHYNLSSGVWSVVDI